MNKSAKAALLPLLAAASLAACAPTGSGSGADSSTQEGVYMYGDEQKYQKFWEDQTIYNETVCLVEEDGQIYGNLLFEPTDVISVRDYTTEKEIDPSEYRIEGNRIIRAEGSSLPYFTQENLRGENLPSEYAIDTYQGKEHPIMFTEGPGIVMHQLNVTYRHAGSWDGYKPGYLGADLPKTIEKLRNRERLTIGFYGDSIMTGCNASSKLVIPPYLDDFPTASVKMLKQLYGYDGIEFFNTSKGGTLSEWGRTNVDVNVNDYSPDLVFIGFGMNDGSWNVKPADFIYNIEFMVASIQARNPDAEIVLVSTILANPESTQSAGQENYLQPLKDLSESYDGVALMDMTSYSQYLLGHKRSVDILANNINHPSDFLVRGYVSSILASLYEDF
ncbi:MAG TPA: SGNH/GDSL hydrolase family protein [Candidatus Enteromonas pullicola]|uniref:SGNH/GDSL hydrolase family protein n=1 Tax=Candidatus Alloenteromonas pullicola TaxID=2840784 RepID=A0A9D1S2R5_9FIRM|nr:SGNH/GDSL hydrolase family protein [Candidatus Enteromonas pullicola]